MGSCAIFWGGGICALSGAFFITLFWVRGCSLGKGLMGGGGRLELFQSHWRYYGMDILGIKIILIN